jgi:hypothetical protein
MPIKDRMFARHPDICLPSLKQPLLRSLAIRDAETCLILSTSDIHRSTMNTEQAMRNVLSDRPHMGRRKGAICANSKFHKDKNCYTSTWPSNRQTGRVRSSVNCRQGYSTWCTAEQHDPEGEVVVPAFSDVKPQHDNLKASFAPEDWWRKSFKMQNDRSPPPKKKS